MINKDYTYTFRYNKADGTESRDELHASAKVAKGYSNAKLHV